MEYDVKELKQKLSAYLDGSLSKNEFGKWAEKAYYDLLTGGYIELEKLVIYPFLKILSRLNLEVNERADIFPCSEEDIGHIWNVLNDNTTFDFHVEMTIPESIYHKHFNSEAKAPFVTLNRLMDETGDKVVESELFKSNIQEVMMLPMHDNTLLGNIQQKIKHLCKSIIDMDTYLSANCLKLYPLEKKSSLLLENLKNCVECFVGVKSFGVLISYRDNEASVDILL